MNRLFEIFNQIKTNLQKNITTITMADLYYLMGKSTKSDEEKKQILQIHEYIKKMLDCIESLGTRFFDVEIKNIGQRKSGMILYDDIESKIKSLIIIIDTFIDTFSKFIQLLNSKNEGFVLRKLLSYFRESRNYLVRRTSEYSKQVIKNENDKANIRILLNDVIDIFLRESTNLQLIPLHNKLSNMME